MRQTRDAQVANGPTTLLFAVSAASLAILPVFLVGAMAVYIRADLQFSEAQLGGVVAMYFGAAALTSLRAGRFVERVGWGRGLIFGSMATATALLGLGLLASNWLLVGTWLLLAGAALAVTQPAANLALARAVLDRRQGVAFGVKQSAIPIGTFLAGLAVPIFGGTLGWRAAFITAAGIALAFGAGIAAVGAGPPPPALSRPRPAGDLYLPALVLFSIGAGFGMTAGNSLGAFYVESAVTRGTGPAAAGMILAGGSAATVVMRVILGWFIDRHLEWDLRVIAGLMLVGAVVLLALADGLLLHAGTLLAFIAGWGWSGLLVYAIVRHNAAAPAAASGIFLAGVYVGGTVGPLVFGAIVELSSYVVAWLSSGAVLIVSAALVTRGAASLARRPMPAPE
jgi:predicted MFS family arabinose efflux permease